MPSFRVSEGWTNPIRKREEKRGDESPLQCVPPPRRQPSPFWEQGRRSGNRHRRSESRRVGAGELGEYNVRRDVPVVRHVGDFLHLYHGSKISGGAFMIGVSLMVAHGDNTHGLTEGRLDDFKAGCLIEQCDPWGLAVAPEIPWKVVKSDRVGGRMMARPPIRKSLFISPTTTHGTARCSKTYWV